MIDTSEDCKEGFGDMWLLDDPHAFAHRLMMQPPFRLPGTVPPLGIGAIAASPAGPNFGVVDPAKLAAVGWVSLFTIWPQIFFLSPPFFIGLLCQPTDTGRGRG